MPYKNKKKRNEYNKKWRKNNKKKQREYNIKWKQKLRDWYANYKLASPCVVCGETRPAVLEAHHVHPENKSFSMHEGVKLGVSIRRLETEASKCIIVCCLCHRLFHMRAFNSIEQQNWNRQIEIFEKNNGTHYFGQPRIPKEFEGKPKTSKKSEGMESAGKRSGRAKVRDLKEKKRIKVLIDE